jgi:hypothetical protein
MAFRRAKQHPETRSSATAAPARLDRLPATRSIWKLIVLL